jgi:trigger factor
MQVTETLSEGLKRGFTVVVPGPDIEGKRTARLSEISRTLRLPGFRPGKVPLPIVRQRYGTAVMAEVLEESVNDATRQMLADRGLRSAVQPKVELVSGADPAAGKEAADLEFKVEVELLPEITLPDLSDLALVRLKSEPTAEVIDAALAGKIDGVAFPGGTGTDMSVEVGGTGFIPGFSEQMAGMKVGESRTIDVTFPDEYGAKELAGKAATFELTAKALRRSEVPAIDDAMATKMGFEDGLEKMREAVAATIQREYDQVSRLRLKRDLLDQLAGKADFAVPESLVEPEFKQIWDRIEADRAAGKTDEDDAGKDDDTLRADYRAIAERRVRLGLLLAEIGRANGIQVGQDELMRAMRAEASRYQGQERQVMEFFQKNPQAVESLRGPIFEEKVVDYIVELAKVEDKAVTVEELNAEPAPSAALG